MYMNNYSSPHVCIFTQKRGQVVAGRIQLLRLPSNPCFVYPLRSPKHYVLELLDILFSVVELCFICGVGKFHSNKELGNLIYIMNIACWHFRVFLILVSWISYILIVCFEYVT